MAAADPQPYNANNKALTAGDLAAILRRFGVAEPPRDVDLYRRAFVHRSYCTRKNDTFVTGNQHCPPGCLPLQEESYERLEFLGDAVLGLITASYLHERYQSENEGFLTRVRTKLVNGVTLAGFAHALGFPRFVIMSKQIEDAGGRDNKNILEDCFEAFIGALHVDLGFAAAERWVVAFLEDAIDFSELVRHRSNLKEVLFKHFQHTYHEVPQLTDSVQARDYVVTVRVKNGGVIGVGRGKAKRDAERDAVAAALEYCGIAL